MAKYSSVTRKDFEFIAKDIGRELMTFLPAEERLAGISPEERLTGISLEERLAGISDEELLKALDSGVLQSTLSPEYRKILHDILVAAQTASLSEKKTENGTPSRETKRKAKTGKPK